MAAKIGLGSIVKVDGSTITLVTKFKPPAREYERVDVSCLADAYETATLGRRKLWEFEIALRWDPSLAAHQALETLSKNGTAATVILEFTRHSKKWTLTDCYLEMIDIEEVQAGETFMRNLKFFSNDDEITEAAI